LFHPSSVVLSGGILGRSFWLINFPDQDSVPWEEFEKTLMCKKSVTLDDGSTFTKGLSMTRKNPENQKKAKALHLLLAQISGQKNFAFHRVTCENFGKVLTWFGPGVDTTPTAQHPNFLERISYIARQPWFFGFIDNADLLIHDTDNKTRYIIRLSNEPGYFTIQTKKVKSRIVYVPGVGYKPEQEKDTFPDLVKFAEVKLKTFEPQSGSEFTQIFGNSEVQMGLYGAFGTLINNTEQKH